MNAQAKQMVFAARNTASLDLRRLPVLAKQQIDTAELPELYKAAVAALRECDRVDELKDIDDKHSAIAHYAKQIKDDSLFNYAQRIRLRAFERIGELLAEIPESRDRTALGKQHGICPMESGRAVMAVQMPKKVRDQVIEQSPPPSKKQLAEYGREYKATTASFQTEGFRRYRSREDQIKPTPASQAMEFYGFCDSIVRDLKTYLTDNCGSYFTMSQLGRAVHPDDAKEFRKLLIQIIEALDELEQALPKSS